MYGAPGVGTPVRDRAVQTGLSVIPVPLPRRVVDALPGDGRVAGGPRVVAGAQRSPRGTRRAGAAGEAAAGGRGRRLPGGQGHQVLMRGWTRRSGGTRWGDAEGDLVQGRGAGRGGL